jgi:hypothetical protein
MSDDQKDQDRTDLSESPTRTKNKTRPEAERLMEGISTPKVKFCFGIPILISPQAFTLEANINPFTNPGEGNREAELRGKLHEDTMEGWSFQGRRRHVPKLASPRQEFHQHPLPPPTPRNERPCRVEKERTIAF